MNVGHTLYTLRYRQAPPFNTGETIDLVYTSRRARDKARRILLTWSTTDYIEVSEYITPLLEERDRFNVKAWGRNAKGKFARLTV